MVARELAPSGKLIQRFRIHFLFAVRRTEPNIGEPIGWVLLQSATPLLDAGVIVSRVVFNFGTDGIEQRRNRVELESAGIFLERLRQAIAHDAIVTEPQMRGGTVWAETDSALKLLFGFLKVPFVTEGDVAQNGVGLGKVRIELQGTVGSFACFGLGIGGR